MVSVLLHVALILSIVQLGREQDAIAGEPGPGQQGGGGGGGGSPGRGLAAVTYYVTIEPLASEAPATIELPPIEPIEPLSVDVPPAPTIEAPPIEIADVTLGGGGVGTGEGPGTGSGAGPGSGSGTGGGSGSGTGTGDGAGTGPGSGGGGTIRPPEPVGLLIPPMPPSSVRGRSIPIRVRVDERGRVTDVTLLASSGHGRYDRELRRAAEGWQFRPARDQNGRAIPYDFPYTVEF